jgi:hypothetical protein
VPYRLSGAGDGRQHAGEGLLAIVQGLERVAGLERPSRERIADPNLCSQARRESGVRGTRRSRGSPRQLRPTNTIDAEQHIEHDAAVGDEAADRNPAECTAGIGLGQERMQRCDPGTQYVSAD